MESGLGDLADHANNPDAHGAFLTEAQILALIAGNRRTPIGQPFFHLGDGPPLGALQLSGYVLSRTDYAVLWDHINASANKITLISDSAWHNNRWGCYSTGNGTTTFRVPQTINEFIRARSSGQSIGTWQSDEFKSHRHKYTDVYTSPRWERANGRGLGIYEYPTSNGGNTTLAGGSETRPRNIAWMFCVYYQ